MRSSSRRRPAHRTRSGCCSGGRLCSATPPNRMSVPRVTTTIRMNALGLPNYNSATGTGAVSLGSFGTLIVRFVDNSLTPSGNATADRHIFEIGPEVDVFNLSISVDGITWIDLGNVSGQPTSVDIDGRRGRYRCHRCDLVSTSQRRPRTGQPGAARECCPGPCPSSLSAA